MKRLPLGQFALKECLTFLYQAISDPHFIPMGGGGAGIWTPTISLALNYTNVIFCKLSEIPFEVSENKRLVKNLLYGCHGNYLITLCFSPIIVKMFIKTGNFQMLPETTNFKALK